MNRLQAELQRLYLLRPQASGGDCADPSALIGPSGTVRALVMELTRPPSWDVLAKVWQGVQRELELPAPAIAVSGTDGLQLWFSLAQPVSVPTAHAFLEGLRMRYLADVEPRRFRLMPAPEASALRQDLHARPVPACQQPTGNWSAFLAQDLVPIFSETPWLDVAPNEEGQASLLHALQTTAPEAFEAALLELAPGTPPTPPTPPTPSETAVAVSAQPATALARPIAAAPDGDPKRFLLQVMNDETVALALRIDAAKALLQHSSDSRPRQGD